MKNKRHLLRRNNTKNAQKILMSWGSCVLIYCYMIIRDLINQRNRFRELAYRKNRKQVNFDLLRVECNYKYVTHAYIFKNIVNLTSHDLYNCYVT